MCADRTHNQKEQTMTRIALIQCVGNCTEFKSITVNTAAIESTEPGRKEDGSVLTTTIITLPNGRQIEVIGDVREINREIAELEAPRVNARTAPPAS